MRTTQAAKSKTAKATDNGVQQSAGDQATITMSVSALQTLQALAIAGAEAAVKDVPGSDYRQRAKIAMVAAQALDLLAEQLTQQNAED